VIIASADAVIALAGEGGTLAEIGFAKKFGKPIVALDSWREIEGLDRADTAVDAVAMALKLAASNSRRRS
jgi:predicted Rossmann-fold nucleotide-binding protein